MAAEAESARTLVLLRHAKAVEHTDAEHDRARELAPRGLRDAAVAGRWLADNVGVIEMVVHSPAARARQSWEAVAEQLVALPPVLVDERLYGEPVPVLYGVLRELPTTASTVLLVGHNPEFSELAASLTGEAVGLSTCSIAVLRLSAGWESAGPRAAELIDTVTPRAD
jgi:phosphohistidine phosphatase